MVPCADETDHHRDHDHSLAAPSVSVYVLETVIFGTFGDSFIHSFTKKGTRDQCFNLPVARSSGSEGGVTNHSALRVLYSNICRFLSLKYHHNHTHTVN